MSDKEYLLEGLYIISEYLTLFFGIILLSTIIAYFANCFLPRYRKFLRQHDESSFNLIAYDELRSLEYGFTLDWQRPICNTILVIWLICIGIKLSFTYLLNLKI